MIKGLYSKIDSEKVKYDLKSKGHQDLCITNLTKSDTSIPLLMFLVELAAIVTNKEIYGNVISNTIVRIEPPRVKRDIPQCTRCQSFGLARNYCNRKPACVKEHLTTQCSQQGRIENVICVNSKEKHQLITKGVPPEKRKLQKPIHQLETDLLFT